MEIWPVRISATEWHLVDKDNGDIKVMATRISSRWWLATLNPKLFAEHMNFQSFTGDCLEKALLGVIRKNQDLALHIARKLGEIDSRVEPNFEEPTEDVQAEQVFDDILAAM